jgi:hypothetical protein
MDEVLSGKTTFNANYSSYYPSIYVYNHIPYVAVYTGSIDAITVLKYQP